MSGELFRSLSTLEWLTSSLSFSLADKNHRLLLTYRVDGSRVKPNPDYDGH